jgi:hypothetical protein
MISPVSPSQIASAGVTLSARGSRTTIPVAPSAYIYSHFKHVSGVPAPEGTKGVAVSKIKILDTLIEHLSQARKKSNVSPELDTSKMSDHQLNIAIQNLQNEIDRLSASGASMPYSPLSQPAAGTLFSISV